MERFNPDLIRRSGRENCLPFIYTTVLIDFHLAAVAFKAGKGRTPKDICSDINFATRLPLRFLYPRMPGIPFSSTSFACNGRFGCLLVCSPLRSIIRDTSSRNARRSHSSVSLCWSPFANSLRWFQARSREFLQFRAVTELAISVKFSSTCFQRPFGSLKRTRRRDARCQPLFAYSICQEGESETLPEGKHFRETVAHVKTQGSDVSHGRNTGVEIASTWRSRGTSLPETNA